MLPDTPKASEGNIAKKPPKPPRETSPKSMKPESIEITEPSQDVPEPKADVPITFYTHVGWDGVLLLLFPLGVSGLFVYITFLYTKSFQAWHRPWVWVFMVFASFYAILPLVYCLCWKKIAKGYLRDASRARHDLQVSEQRSHFRGIYHLYLHFKLNGKYFLWKLYFLKL